MTHAEFVYPAYALTIAGLVGTVVWSLVAMRRAEGTASIAARRAEGTAGIAARRAEGTADKDRRR